ncbi:MAG TPA: crossover junction endodeoxyribonuclease RuvC, partial [Candidatus Portnoybacteria bacterium]|nr:crossover junction endodeoxyribonuclease RuvC [Candidatus Portnoybacteria bacterium]
LVIEKLFFFKNKKTVIEVAQARGIIILAASLKNIPVTEVTPLQVKIATVGYGRADKNQVQIMIKNILSLPEIPQPDDVADALAIAYYGAVAINSKFSQ